MNLSQLNRILLQLLLLPVLALSILSGVFVWQLINAVRTVQQLQLADRGLSLISSVSADVVNEESGLRGYQVTANPIFLQPYWQAAKPLAQDLHDLRENVAQMHGDLRKVDRVAEAHGQWQIGVAQPLLQATSNGIDTSGTEANLRGKARMDAIVAQLDDLEAQQHAIRDQAVLRFERAVRHTMEIAIGMALVVGLLIGIFSRRQLHAVSSIFQKTLATLRRNAQDIHASEQRLRTILLSLGEGVAVCGRDGRIELLNPAAQKLTGWTETEAAKRPATQVFRFLKSEDRSPLPLPVKEALQGQRGQLPTGVALLLRRDGSVISAEGLAEPIRNERGEVTGAVMAFRDVTEQRHTQSALLASEKQAVAGRLAASIAHEIHNPLDATVNLLYLLRNDPAPEETQEFLDMAAGELDRISQICRAMLGLYRESRTPVAVDMVDLMQSLLLLLERNLVQADVRVETHYDEPAVVTGYPAELRQVFTNLFTNALDASPPGSTIRASIRRTGAGEPEGLYVSVVDEGPGISANDLEHLFQPFYTTKGEHGTGLGLWVSRGIVEKHGGTIHIETSTAPETHGTTLKVFLPRGEAQSE